MDPLLLHAGNATASVHPGAGGRLGQLTVDGHALLRGPDRGAALGWGWWGAYPLLPWSNRIPGGRIDFEGRRLSVPVNWSDGTALHGLVADVPWTVVASTVTSAELTVEVDVGCYRVDGRQGFAIDPDGLDLRLSVVNRSVERVPVGLGIHPWLRCGPVAVPADRAWEGDGPLPTGSTRPVGPDDDLRAARVPPPMDRCYTALHATVAEVPGLRLRWSGPVTQVVVYSEDPEWVCVEPVTMANDGFRLAADGVPGTGVVGLDPGAELAVSYRFEWGDPR